MNREQRCCLAIVVGLQLAITVDDVATELYADGVSVIRSLPRARFNTWTIVDTLNIPADTRVIAVKGHDIGVSCPLF